jgi:hypothetical protein
MPLALNVLQALGAAALLVVFVLTIGFIKHK